MFSDLISKFSYFWENATFSMIKGWFFEISNSPLTLIFHPLFLFLFVLTITLLIFRSTAPLGKNLLIFLPAATYTFITLVVVKNEGIYTTPTFLMLAVAVMFIGATFLFRSFVTR
ncbi:MAG: hypothetical protein ACN4E2_04085 [Nitrospinota bacterium]